MKKILCLTLVAISLACSKDKTEQQKIENEISTSANVEKTISDYVPIDYQIAMGNAVEAINYGFEKALTNNTSKKTFSNGNEFELAEKYAFEFLGVESLEKENSTILRKPAETTEEDEPKQDLTKVMSPQMINYNVRLIDLYSAFENEEREEDWNENAELNNIVSKIYELENLILKDEKLLEWERTALLASTLTAKVFTPSIKKFAENIANTDQSAQSQRFFSKIWKGVKSAARAVASVVVKSVAVVTSSVLHSFSSAVQGITNKEYGSGLFKIAFMGAGCATVGSIKGFFQGLGRSFNGCGAFSFYCIIKKEKGERYACEAQNEFEQA